MQLAVIAIGGNSLIKRREQQSVDDQYAALCETMAHVADMIAMGWRVLITHGNGPQVGFIMLRSEIARAATGLHPVPLVSCVADTQGAIGYQIQQALGNELARRGLPGQTITLVTQVLVDANDEAMRKPTKFIGEFYTSDQLDELAEQHPDWMLKADGQRGWRRVVPSPKPLDIIEVDAVRHLLNAGFHVCAAGGGGIPVMRNAQNDLVGVDAVIDKDLASSLLATTLGAELLVISTAVEQVALNYGQENQRLLSVVPAAEMEGYYRQGHFPEGSMGPKIRAALDFIHRGGKEVIITNPEHLEEALTQGKGTRVVAEEYFHG